MLIAPQRDFGDVFVATAEADQHLTLGSDVARCRQNNA